MTNPTDKAKELIIIDSQINRDAEDFANTKFSCFSNPKKWKQVKDTFIAGANQYEKRLTELKKENK